MESPVRIVVSGEANDGATVQALVEMLQSDEDFGGVTTEESSDGAITFVNAITKADPYSNEAESIVSDLRDEVVLQVFGSEAGDVYITGATAETIDFDSALTDTTCPSSSGSCWG